MLVNISICFLLTVHIICRFLCFTQLLSRVRIIFSSNFLYIHRIANFSCFLYTKSTVENISKKLCNHLLSFF